MARGEGEYENPGRNRYWGGGAGCGILPRAAFPGDARRPAPVRADREARLGCLSHIPALTKKGGLKWHSKLLPTAPVILVKRLIWRIERAVTGADRRSPRR